MTSQDFVAKQVDTILYHTGFRVVFAEVACYGRRSQTSVVALP
ncbi:MULTISPECIES: hypothetical protein [Trichocoleus]|nr:hypothetical protein [Trichocoleus sp. FACHB-46]